MKGNLFNYDTNTLISEKDKERSKAHKSRSLSETNDSVILTDNLL